MKQPRGGRGPIIQEKEQSARVGVRRWLGGPEPNR